MKASEGKPGRIFLIRLEAGDVAAESIERLASEKGVAAAQVFFLGTESLTGIIAPDAVGVPRLRLPSAVTMDDRFWNDAEVVVQELAGVDFSRIAEPESGHETMAGFKSAKTRLMEKAAPPPEESGPGTIPVYLFNAEFN